jgi:hypothetical protein
MTWRLKREIKLREKHWHASLMRPWLLYGGWEFAFLCAILRRWRFFLRWGHACESASANTSGTLRGFGGPHADKPARDKPARDKPARDKPARDKPAYRFDYLMGYETVS